VTPKYSLLIGALLLAGSGAATADQVIADNLIGKGSACLGSGCEEGEAIEYDTLRLKSDAPQLLFQDTSISAAFPTVDWRIGVTDGASSLPAALFIMNVDSGTRVLQISPDGDLALGAGAEPAAGAISVGAPGHTRRITQVADGIDDTDAVTLGQFDDYKASVDTTDVDQRIQALEQRIADLSARIGDLAQ